MSQLFQDFKPYLLGLLLGLLVGFERERSHPRGAQAFGVRTFALFGLLGALGGHLPSIPLQTTLMAFAGGTILLGYLRSARRPGEKTHPGLTTEISAMAVFSLGYLGVESPAMALLLGALVLGVLAAREPLHHFTRQVVRQNEAYAFVSLLVLALGILPLFPDRALDPWGAFNPFRFGALLVALGGVQFLSHVALRALGHRWGLGLAGFLSGFVSSTATYLHLRRRMGHASASWMQYGLMALLAATTELVAILAATNRALLLSLWPSFALAGLVTLSAAGLLHLAGRRSSASAHDRGEESRDPPFHWKSQLKLAAMLFLIMSAVTLAQRFLGQRAFWAVTFLGGLFELHGVSFTLASGQIGGENARAGVAIAYSASLISKLAIVLWPAGLKPAWLPKILLAGILLGVGAVFALALFWNPTPQA